jgi:hypothetical protein
MSCQQHRALRVLPVVCAPPGSCGGLPWVEQFPIQRRQRQFIPTALTRLLDLHIRDMSDS